MLVVRWWRRDVDDWVVRGEGEGRGTLMSFEGGCCMPFLSWLTELFLLFAIL